MLTKLKLYIYGAFGVALAFVLALVYRNGRSDQQNTQIRGQLDAMREAKEIKEDVETQDDTYLVDVLTGRVRK